MGVQLTFGTVGATGGGWSIQPGTLQPAFEDRPAEPKWTWQQRSHKTWKDRNQWGSLWSGGARLGGGDLEGYFPRGLNGNDLYEPYSCDGEGTQSTKFLRGSCIDEADAPVANAIVQGFRTADDVFTGQVASNLDGTYILPTDNPSSVQHYVVAYKPGSPDIFGTSANTLLPTNVDGS